MLSTTMIEKPAAIVFMKVGFHGEERLESIIARKCREEETSGMTFWGYGGTLCHPTKQIQPLVQRSMADGALVRVFMAVTPSKFKSKPIRAREFSNDGNSWLPLPAGVNIVASRYALVLTELRQCEIKVDLGSYVVAVGQSAGRRLSEYIVGRVDKGCAIYEENFEVSSKVVQVALTGLLVAPYAVFLR
jgi:hypothetical protein